MKYLKILYHNNRYIIDTYFIGRNKNQDYSLLSELNEVLVLVGEVQ